MKCTQCGNANLVRTCAPFVLANSMTPIESFICTACGHYEFFLAGKVAKREATVGQVRNDMEDLRELQIEIEGSETKPKE